MFSPLSKLSKLVTETGNREDFCAYEDINYSALGLASEAGEVAGEVKKIFRNDNGILVPYRRQKIRLELGDVLWYTESMARCMSTSIPEIIDLLDFKLRERLKDGTIQERERNT